MATNGMVDGVGDTMKTNRAFVFSLLLVLFIRLGHSAERPIRIAYPGISIGAMVPALAQEKGFFQQEGIP